MTYDLRKLYDDELKLCGCGNPEYVLLFIRDILQNQLDYEEKKINSEEYYKKIDQLLPSEGIQNMILSMLDNAGLIEHGGNIRSFQLCGGYRYLEMFEKYTMEQLLEKYFPED